MKRGRKLSVAAEAAGVPEAVGVAGAGAVATAEVAADVGATEAGVDAAVAEIVEIAETAGKTGLLVQKAEWACRPRLRTSSSRRVSATARSRRLGLVAALPTERFRLGL